MEDTFPFIMSNLYTSRAATHSWDLSPAEARQVQKRLQDQVIATGEVTPRCVAGVDAAFDTHRGITRAAAALLSFPQLELLEHCVVEHPTRFPYVPGLLSFREIPAVMDALGRLERKPDVVICDGQGYAHPRRFGLACHLGVLLNLPSVGVAKTRLVGTHGNVDTHKGAWVPLTDAGEVIGAVLRTRVRVKPVYVSIGHRVSLKAAISLTLACTPRFRLPETTRMADRLAGGRPPKASGTRDGSSGRSGGGSRGG